MSLAPGSTGEAEPAVALHEKCRALADTARAVVGAHQAVVSLSSGRGSEQVVQAVSLSDRYADFRSFEAKPNGLGIDGFVCETNRPLRLTQAELEAHPRWRYFGEHGATHPPRRPEDRDPDRRGIAWCGPAGRRSGRSGRSRDGHRTKP